MSIKYIIFYKGDLQTQFEIVNRQKNEIMQLKHEIKMYQKKKDED